MTNFEHCLQVFTDNLPFPVVNTKQDVGKTLCNQYSQFPQSIHVCTVNAEIAHRLLNDKRSQQSLKSVNYFVPDGIGVALACKYLFGVDAGKLPGIEFSEDLLKECQRRAWNVALYGATDDCVSRASKYLKNKFQGLRIAAILDGYSDSNSLKSFLFNCKDQSVKVVLVALGHPAQDEFISKNLDLFPAIWVGVGGSFDVWSGSKKRSPRFISLLGMEWVYRILQDPSPARLKRSLDLPAFCFDMLLYRFGGLRRG
jgi:N-acetylglucosaminyldiphosphoundecaprenol N-acetyl-beta-D-mannosaminyltransferase